jgi:alkanesulfonate monooxygenase SsuD/methylene tetrahydromethanopterin reductase-like flavin-dependent oxidoreductase (luciferase family)
VQSSRADQVHGRLDAVLIVARAAPLTRHVGLMPTVIVTHTEPFHVSKAIATLDYVEVLRRLWDSWEDDAEIRDTATGRFVDRGKLHYIKFAGDYFSVKGPSITPRPPQGQPVVAALGHAGLPYRLIGADLPRDDLGAVRLLAR